MIEEHLAKFIFGLLGLGIVNIAATVISNWASMKVVLYRIGALEVKGKEHDKYGPRITRIEATMEAEAAHGD